MFVRNHKKIKGAAKNKSGVYLMYVHKKGAELSLSYQRYWHTQPQISEPTPKDVSIILIVSWYLKRQFFDTRFKAMLQMFL